MSSLIKDQAPIDKEIANALINATPENWRAAEMAVERQDDGVHETMQIVISSPEGYREPVVPTDEIYSALYKLSDVFRLHGAIWKGVSYSISQRDDDNWGFSVRFEY